MVEDAREEAGRLGSKARPAVGEPGGAPGSFGAGVRGVRFRSSLTSSLWLAVERSLWAAAQLWSAGERSWSAEAQSCRAESRS